LEAAMRRGTMPELDRLVGREYRGAITQRISSVLRVRRFVKGFSLQVSGGVIGYNVRVTGSDLESPWTTARWLGRREFGFFSVQPVHPEGADKRYLNALLLDYGAMGSGPDPMRLIRDYVTCVHPGSELMLGQAFAAVSRTRIPLGFFVLEPL
jgi:hypothetical protein